MSDGQGGARSTVLLAGWLFADLAVGLVIILLATATDTPLIPPESSPPPVALPTSTPTPTPTPTAAAAAAAGLEREPVVVEVSSDADALLGGDRDELDEVAETIRAELGPYEEQERTTGFVLTWGGSPGNAGEGVRLAGAANEVFRDAMPEFTEVATMRDLWTGGAARGTLIFEVFLFVEG